MNPDLFGKHTFKLLILTMVVAQVVMFFAGMSAQRMLAAKELAQLRAAALPDCQKP